LLQKSDIMNERNTSKYFNSTHYIINKTSNSNHDHINAVVRGIKYSV